MMSQLLLGASKKQTVSTLDMVDPFGDNSGVALYKFDGDVTDEGGAYNGTVIGSATYQDGVFQSSAKNSTVNDYIQFSNLGTWFASRSAYSFSVWAKVPEQSTGSAKIFHVCSPTLSSPYYVFALSMTSSGVATWNSIYDGGFAIFYSNTMALDTFYHLCVTFNNGVQKLYVNGTFVGTHSGATITGTTHDTAMIGRIPTQNTLSNSNIVTTDQMRIFNRALTVTEVTALYNEEPYQVATIPTDGLIASWELNTDATDSVGIYSGTSYGVTYNGDNASFNGTTSSYIQVGNNLSAFRTPVHSYGCWVKFNSTSTDPIFISNNAYTDGPGSTYNTGTALQCEGSKILAMYVFVNTETTTDSNGNTTTSYASIAKSSEVVSLGVWYHVFLVMNTNNVKLYINGVLDSVVSSVQSTNYTSPPKYPSSNNYSLGVLNYGTIRHLPLNGYLDKAKHYNRVLTSGEISTIYNAEKGAFGL